MILCRHSYFLLCDLSFYLWCFSLLFHQPPPAAVGFVSEDEYLEIQGITREQSGEYECSASNDVAAPVVRRVKVTVNCKWSRQSHPAWHEAGWLLAWPQPRVGLQNQLLTFWGTPCSVGSIWHEDTWGNAQTNRIIGWWHRVIMSKEWWQTWAGSDSFSHGSCLTMTWGRLAASWSQQRAGLQSWWPTLDGNGSHCLFSAFKRNKPKL